MRLAFLVLGTATLLPGNSVLSATSTAPAGDVVKGRRAFTAQCAACHTLTARSMPAGPGLAGIVGRKAAAMSDYAFSEALKKSGVVWDASILDRYLADPAQIAPGGTMVYKVPSAAVRADLIAFLAALPNPSGAK